jgi:hypothetical protein
MTGSSRRSPTGAAQAARNTVASLARVPAPPVTVVVTDSLGKARPLPFVASSGSTSEFSATVPPNAAFDLEGRSSLLALRDAAGNRLPQNVLRSSITSPAAIPQPVVRWQFSQASTIPSLILDLPVTGALVP